MKINPYKYPFIAIEGIDGCGKSTLMEKLEKWDKDRSVGSIFTKEPTDGDWGQLIRLILKNDGYDISGKKIKPNELQKVYIWDRLEHRQVESAFLEKYPIFSDRDFPSTMAYGMAEGLEPWWILRKHEEIMGEYFFAPDLILILDLPAEEAIKRIKKSGKEADYFEKKLVLQKKIRDSYLSFSGLMKEYYSDIRINIQIIDAMPSPAEILKASLVWIDKVFQEKLEATQYKKIFEKR